MERITRKKRTISKRHYRYNSTYEDFENDNSDDDEVKSSNKQKTSGNNNKNKDKKDEKKDKNEVKGSEEYVDNDEFNVSLAAMEEEIKPKVISLIQNLSKNYTKLRKYQIEKLNCILNSKNSLYQKIKI